MRRIAEVFEADADLWEITGLCHDLDYFETTRDPSQHGVTAALWLDNELPLDALNAIRSHDHRTGIQSETVLADALKLADALAVIDATLDREAMAKVRAPAGAEILRAMTSDRPYLAPIITDLADRHHLSLSALANMCLEGPPQ